MIANKHVSRIRFKSVFILLAIALLNAGAFYQASELLADDDHNRKLQAVAQKYDIEIVTTKADESRSNRFGEIECKTAEASAIEKYVPLFVDEFQLYPKALVKMPTSSVSYFALNCPIRVNEEMRSPIGIITRCTWKSSADQVMRSICEESFTMNSFIWLTIGMTNTFTRILTGRP